ncbi:MAG: radical SAM protein [Anaerolineae bacterium]
MELAEKLDLLGTAAQGDVACNSCAANPGATVVTHRATQPLRFDDLHAGREGPEQYSPSRRDLSPWLSRVIRADGKVVPIVKTLMTSACEKDCFYCPTRRGRNGLRRVTFKPEELAFGFHQIQQKGLAEGIFLSSGVIGGGTRTMEKTIAAIDILRTRYQFQGYVHLKLMPGAEQAAVERALGLADRVSVNLEAPNSERLMRLSSTKQFTDELLAPLRLARRLIDANPEHRRVSMTTQFVVGAAGESDREILTTTAQLYNELRLARVYYSAFRPIEDTPLENHPPTPPIRERRLYETDFLLRQYGFTYDDLVFDQAGNLPVQFDPKMTWALVHPERFPLELNRASREELLRIPGIGPKSAQRIIQLRRTHKLDALAELARLGADAKRAAPFVLMNGKQPAFQLSLF